MARAVVEPRTSAPHDPTASFEAAWIVRGEAEMDDFLPPPGHRDRAAAALALARLDLDFRRGSARARTPEDYFRAYPEIGQAGLAEIALADYRARLEGGERVTPADYRARMGIDTRGWPAPGSMGRWGRPSVETRGRAGATVTRSRLDPAAVARSYLDFHVGKNSGPDLEGWRPCQGSDETVDVLRDLHRCDPEGARQVAEGVARMPEIGSEFLGFRLISELGRGAFGRVFLASQGDLACRPVALKVSAEKPAESQTLARLQHTNIVPIFSAHSSGPFHAVCMPYFGSTTLKDVFEELELRPGPPTSGEDLLKSLGSKKLGGGDTLSAPSSDPDEEATGPAEGPSPPKSRSDTIQMLGRLPYVQAVLWLGSRLADGLSHAHGRGILHRDLKPANILLTDDGQPMLLDFNLSEDTRRPASAASFGGTLPYMAPEHIRAFRGDSVAVDERSDIYSLGIILFELLAGRHPFGVHAGSSGVVLKLMTEDRQKAPPGSASSTRRSPGRSSRSSATAWSPTPRAAIRARLSSTRTWSGSWRTCPSGMPRTPRSPSGPASGAGGTRG